jgi:hypothetical protein
VVARARIIYDCGVAVRTYLKTSVHRHRRCHSPSQRWAWDSGNPADRPGPDFAGHRRRRIITDMANGTAGPDAPASPLRDVPPALPPPIPKNLEILQYYQFLVRINALVGNNHIRLVARQTDFGPSAIGTYGTTLKNQ